MHVFLLSLNTAVYMAWGEFWFLSEWVCIFPPRPMSLGSLSNYLSRSMEGFLQDGWWKWWAPACTAAGLTAYELFDSLLSVSLSSSCLCVKPFLRLTSLPLLNVSYVPSRQTCWKVINGHQYEQRQKLLAKVSWKILGLEVGIISNQ